MVKRSNIDAGNKLIIDTTKGSVVIDLNIEDNSKWYIVADEAYRPDREKFLIDKFNKEYQIPGVNGIDKLYALCSRSKALNTWLAFANAEYASTETVPTYYKDLVNKEVYNESQKTLTELSKINKLRADEEAKAAAEYSKKLIEINEKYSRRQSPLLQNKIIKILNMKSTDLPLTLQLMIENYTPADVTTAPDRRMYGRELLIRYKMSLLNILNNNADVDIDAIIAELSVK
jgi:hypothetical protein